MNFLKRFSTVFLSVLIIAAVFAGCNPPSVTDSINFAATIVTAAGIDFQNIASAAYNGDKFIISAYSTDYPEDRSDYDNYMQHRYLITADEKNGIVKKTELFNKSYSFLYAAKNGTVYGLETAFEDYVDANGRAYSVANYFVVTIDEDLNVTPVLSLTDVVPNLSSAYVADFKADANGNVYVLADGSAYGVNIASGKCFFSKPKAEVNGNIKGFVQSPDGEMNLVMVEFITTSESTSLADVIAEVNTETGNLEASISFPAEDKTFAGGLTFPFYTYNSSYIYGIDPKTSEKTVVANLLASGFAPLVIYDVFYVSDEKFAVLGSDRTTHIAGVYMLEKTDDIPIKKAVTITALSTNYFTDYYIKEFNLRSDEYQAELKSYDAEGLSATDRLTAFNADFAAGITPDVLIINKNMDYYGYVSKNLFADLYPLIDEDPDISREDLVQSVMKAHETNGKLYSISPHYVINTLIGKTEIFGDKKEQTLAELQAAAAFYPNANLLGNNITASEAAADFVIRALTDYVDFTDGECNFNTPEFIALLEAAKTYPVEGSVTAYSFEAHLASIMNDETLLFNQNIYDFRDIADARYVYFDAPITLLGGKTAVIVPMDEVAIISNAKNPDGAWEFIKGYMQYKGPEDTETGSYTKALSIWQKNIDDFAADALNDPYYTDYLTGEKVYRNHMTFINGQALVVPNNTPEDNAMLIELLNSVTHVYHNERNIIQIVSEESNTFFKGQKSAAEAAAMIENRVSTYLAERG
jgi:hypothetical protein